MAVGDEVSRLWRKHQFAQFPERLKGAELNGVDLVALEADVAGCVEGWRAAGGILDDDLTTRLTGRVEDLDAVMPQMTSRAEVLYFERLCQVALVVLDS